VVKVGYSVNRAAAQMVLRIPVMVVVVAAQTQSPLILQAVTVVVV
jgi:hypothetical protein